MQANAARAVALGLGGMPAPEPPPLYSFDGDIGRLAITTPAYSTAVLAVNQRAFPYGGHGAGPALRRRPARGRRTSAAVPGRASASSSGNARRRRSLTLAAPRKRCRPATAARAAVVATRPRCDRAQPYPPRPYGGPFETLVAQWAHRIRRGGGRDHSPLQPKPRSRRAGRSRGGGAAATPSTCCFPRGAARASIEAVLRGGRRVRLAAPGRRRRTCRCATSPTSTSPARTPAMSSCRPAGGPAPRRTSSRPKPQSSAPRPGPTLAMQLAQGKRFRRLGLAVRVAPAASKADAARAARRLRKKPRGRRR